MKSLLVDALRRANSSGEGPSVSDSGSFESPTCNFGRTANDDGSPITDERDLDSEELELLRSTGMIVIDNADATLEDDHPSDAAQITQTLVHADAELPTPRPGIEKATVADRSASLARHSPLLCLSLAIIAAGLCVLYQQFELRYIREAFAIDRNPAGIGVTAATERVDNANAQRFLFLPVRSADDSESAR